MLLEVACFNLEDAVLAQQAGADRIEFCEDYVVGGITPGKEDILSAREKIKIPLYVMIRPVAPDFTYNTEEIEEMKRQILFCKEIKCDGVVFGILNLKKEVDKKLCKELVDLAKPMACTFHRAFDETTDLYSSLEDIIECGFDRILTSGGKGRAADNLKVLNELVNRAKDRIIIMPGGGVRTENAKKIIADTHCQEIHTAAVNRHSGRLVVSEIKQIKALI